MEEVTVRHLISFLTLAEGDCVRTYPMYGKSSIPHEVKITVNNGDISNVCWLIQMRTSIIIHQTHYQKSDWSRAFNQFTIACELDMINAIFAVDIAFTMSSSTSAWLLSPLECSPQKQNG